MNLKSLSPNLSHYKNPNSLSSSYSVFITHPLNCTNEKRSGTNEKINIQQQGSSAHVKGVGKLVMVNEEKGVFGLPDLLKAAAEVLGNGAFGLSYKAVMANRVAVVVKRTREMKALEKDGLDAGMNKIGKLEH